jgi:hypothetical protein
MRAFIEAFPDEPKLAADYEQLMRCEGYEPFLDLVGRRQLGRGCHVLFRIVGSDEPRRPLRASGTCSQYRRMGLAEALLSEGLRRLNSVVRHQRSFAFVITTLRQ